MKRNYLLLFVCLWLVGGLHAEEKLSKEQAIAVKQELVEQWKADVRARYRQTWNDKCVRIDTLKMPFWVKIYGEKPKDGYRLYISLHGGGTAPAAVNDQQYENQKRLYAPKNSVYLVPRAPYNLWNMWCRPMLDQFYEALIQMGIVFEDVNPDKVYIMGYSAGGDGVWRMAPRMADTWAAASMMAGHPGDVSLLNLRNTPFMIWCGADDAAYDRNKLDEQRGVQMDSLQQADPEGYIHETHIVKGMGHWMQRVDTVAVDWMAQYQRNPYPKKIVWQQEEVRRPSFYWITIPKREMLRGKTIRLSVEGNVINITECNYKQLTLSLNDELVNLDEKVTVLYRGKKVFKGKLKRSRATLEATLKERNDPRFAFPAQVRLDLR